MGDCNSFHRMQVIPARRIRKEAIVRGCYERDAGLEHRTNVGAALDLTHLPPFFERFVVRCSCQDNRGMRCNFEVGLEIYAVGIMRQTALINHEVEREGYLPHVEM